jgi:N-acetylmuramoyl-L-alanine amidase
VKLKPRVIVEHIAVAPTWKSVWNTFEPDVPDSELHELPGLCSHYVIGETGQIIELVPPRLRCRHTVGLNHVAFGIEHVGVSDGDVMGRRRQLAASLRLTRWLQSRYGIRDRDVIGHSESLSSPYHRERVAAMRNRTHGDFSARTMRRYRRLL